MDLKSEALGKLIQSVNIFPYNWSAWLELLNCCLTFETVPFHYYLIEFNFI